MFYKLNLGNQNNLIYKSTKGLKWINDIKKKYSWENYDVYDNRLTNYMENLFDDVVEDINEEIEDSELWLRLTYGQKIFYTYLVFEGEVDNGGLYQFFWNRFEHADSVLEILEILNLKEIFNDYKNELAKFKEIFNEINELKNELEMVEDLKEEMHHEKYLKGYELFGGESSIEGYFYDEKFRKGFNKAMCDFIENNLELFIEG